MGQLELMDENGSFPLNGRTVIARWDDGDGRLADWLAQWRGSAVRVLVAADYSHVIATLNGRSHGHE